MIENKRTVSIDKMEKGEQAVRPKETDERDRQEKAAAQMARAEARRLQEANRDTKTNREMREAYANAVFWYLVGYSVFSGIIVLLDGWKVFGFSLPVAALTAIVGSTAASAIGLMAIVVTGLFRSHHQAERQPTLLRRKGGPTPRES
jgi:hypothetical protein